jgi:hypothetical protein
MNTKFGLVETFPPASVFVFLVFIFDSFLVNRYSGSQLRVSSPLFSEGERRLSPYAFTGNRSQTPPT